LLVHIWAVSGISLLGALRTIAVALVIATVVVVGARLSMRDRDAAGVVASLASLGLLVGSNAVTWLLVCPAIAVVVVADRKRHGGPVWPQIGGMLAAAAVVLGLAVSLEVVQLGRAADVADTLLRLTQRQTVPVVPATRAMPDVFVVLLDGYPRHDVLVEHLGLKDEVLLDRLGALGFEVAPNSHSNYPTTNQSLSSLLNYRHLTEWPEFDPLLADPRAVEGPIVHRAISNAAVLREFRALGYHTIAIASGFSQASVRGADEFIDTGQVSAFEIAAVKSSAIVPVVIALDADAFSRSHRERIASVLDAVRSIAETPTNQPKFVFAHVPSPHAPWVSNGDGSPRVATNVSTWFEEAPGAIGMPRRDVIEAFGGQTRHIGTIVADTLDDVVASAPDAVILVLSDHGTALGGRGDDGEVRLRNLFAARTPDRRIFDPDATLVNTFPTLFDRYFGVDLSRSDDTLYASGPRGTYDLIPFE
jgi:hypothetical protein